MPKLSAFADEVTDDFIGQIDYLVSENIKFIEPRFLNCKNIMDLTKSELTEARLIMRDNGIGVSAIGSPIGKVRLDEPFAEHLDKFKHAADLADFFETGFIRMFSYYPPEGENIDNFRDEVMERIAKKAEILKDTEIVMVHENETGIFGHSAENCADMVKTIDSANFKLAYDPANFVWGQKTTDNIHSCWPVMKPYVVHIHIKDWKVGEDIGSIPGEGDGQIPELMAELAAMNYEGFLTMEPHLRKGGQFGGDTGPELFSNAVSSVRKIAVAVNLKLE